MKLSLPIISCKLMCKILLLNLYDKNSRELLSVRMLTLKKTQLDPHAIYIGKTHDILTRLDQNLLLPKNLICVGTGDFEPLIEQKKYNILVVDSGSLFEVHDEIQDIFDFYNQIDAELKVEIVHENGLQAILDFCSLISEP